MRSDCIKHWTGPPLPRAGPGRLGIPTGSHIFRYVTHVRLVAEAVALKIVRPPLRISPGLLARNSAGSKLRHTEPCDGLVSLVLLNQFRYLTGPFP